MQGRLKDTINDLYVYSLVCKIPKSYFKIFRFLINLKVAHCFSKGWVTESNRDLCHSRYEKESGGSVLTFACILIYFLYKELPIDG